MNDESSTFKKAIAALVEQGNAIKKDAHPEDARTHREALPYAREHGSAFAREYADELAATITTYDDANAEEIFQALREHFWSEEWQKR